MSKKEGLDPSKFENYKLVITPEQIEARVIELGRQIAEEYRGKEFVGIGLLDGAAFFTVDLLRVVQDYLLPDAESLRTEFIGVASYDETESSKNPIITKELRNSIHGAHVLLVEDILETGHSLRVARERLTKGNPASIKTAVAFVKPSSKREIAVPVDYIGFPDFTGWGIGYGLDYKGKFRALRGAYMKKDTI